LTASFADAIHLKVPEPSPLGWVFDSPFNIISKLRSLGIIDSSFSTSESLEFKLSDEHAKMNGIKNQKKLSDFFI
jgi:hypothetical protein